jgi:hypothetical protein
MTDASHTEPELASLPPRTMLTIAGSGSPDGPAFAAAVAALVSAVGDRVVLEGTWWSGSDPLSFDLERPDGWSWTIAAPVPDSFEAPDGMRREARPVERFARLVHRGPYDEEGPSLAALYAFVAARGLTPAGAHTEAYLTDPQTIPPPDLRTELRVPVR